MCLKKIIICLFSVEIIIKEECCVSQPITLQLMKRDRNSLQAYPISELREYVNKPPGNIPLSLSEPNFSILYSRLLIGDKNQVSDFFIDKYYLFYNYFNCIFYFRF